MIVKISDSTHYLDWAFENCNNEFGGCWRSFIIIHGNEVQKDLQDLFGLTESESSRELDSWKNLKKIFD